MFSVWEIVSVVNSAARQELMSPGEFTVLSPHNPVPLDRRLSPMDPPAPRPVAQFAIAHARLPRQVRDPAFVLPQKFRVSPFVAYQLAALPI